MPRPFRRVAAAMTTVVLLGAGPVFADPPPSGPPPVLEPVIGRLRVWLVGLTATLATLALIWAGVRYVCAGGDPTQVEKAKTTLKAAFAGYGLAMLAPSIVSLLAWFMGS